MKQVLLRKGRVEIADVPAPALAPKSILVEVSHSLISAGTELSMVESSGASMVEKARTGGAMKVLESIKVRGVKRTLAIVHAKLDQAQPLGYSCAGTVLAVGSDVTQFQAGDRVACAGAGIANHAEVVSVPVNLAVKVPAALDGSSACFVTLGAIALQGVRRAELRLGETVCVIGLGLLGQLTAQLAAAAGCHVIGSDTDGTRLDAALRLGMSAGDKNPETLRSLVSGMTSGQGADATIITASAPSSDPTRLAFHLTRKKGRVVVVGSVGLDLERSPFYEKEQDFLISCSYGPGRYDASYEQAGNDYPYAFVRWTENRNMAAFLSLVAEGKVRTDALAAKSFPVAQAEAAYQALQSDARPLAVVLTYPSPDGAYRKSAPVISISAPRTSRLRLGLIGAGAFVKATHLPVLRSLDKRVEIAGVCAQSAASAAAFAREVKASLTTTDYRELLKSSDIDAVLISTRHDTHAAMAREALAAGKHVFVEKPLALTTEELASLDATLTSLARSPILMVGYNRRFSPFTRELRAAVEKRSAPLVGTYRVNAGALPAGHWASGREGGGRLRGEACHMIDFFRALVGHPIAEASLTALHPGSAPARPDENFSAQFLFEDGSLCDLVYTSLGHPSLPKESVEVHWDGHSAVLDDYKRLEIDGAVRRAGAQDKGHAAVLEVFLDAIAQGSGFPVPWPELRCSAQTAIDLDALAWGRLPGSVSSS